MELVAPLSILRAAFDAAARVAPDKATPAILSHALLSADPSGRVTLTASQLAPLTYSTILSADVKRGGTCAVPVKHLAAVLSTLPAGEVTVTLAKNGSLSIKSGKRQVKNIGTMDPSEYPTIDLATGTAVSVPVNTLRVLVERVLHMAADVKAQDQRPHLAALFLHAHPGRLLAVCTDGGGVAKAEMAVDGLVPWSANGGAVLIPRSSVETIVKQLPDVGRISITVDAHHRATFAWDGASAGDRETYTTKLVDVKFPNWQGAMPSDEPGGIKVTSTIIVDRAALLETVKSACVTMDLVRLSTTSATPSALCVRSSDDDKGEFSDEIDATIKTLSAPPPNTYGTNGARLADALKALDCARVSLGMSGELDPLVMTTVGADGADDGTMIVIAAMRV